MPPKRRLRPLLDSFGVRANHDEKCRALRNSNGSGTGAIMAAAVSSPTQGTCIKRGVGFAWRVALKLRLDARNAAFEASHFFEHLEQERSHRMGDLGLGILDQLRNTAQRRPCPLWNNDTELPQ